MVRTVLYQSAWDLFSEQENSSPFLELPCPWRHNDVNIFSSNNNKNQINTICVECDRHSFTSSNAFFFSSMNINLINLFRSRVSVQKYKT